MDKYNEKMHDQIIELTRRAPHEALDLAEAAARKYPLIRRAWGNLAHVHEARKDYKGALRALEQAISVAPDEPVNQFDLGRVHLKLKQFESAIDDFTRGIDLSIQNDFHYYLDACRLMRAFCYCKLGKFLEAELDLALVEFEDPVWIDKLRSRAELLEACQRHHLN